MSCVPAISGTRPHLVSMTASRVPGRDVSEVGAEGELEAATERNPMNCGDDGHWQFPPEPHHMLRKIGDAVGALAEIGKRQDRIALGRGCHSLDIEPGAERTPLAG